MSVNFLQDVTGPDERNISTDIIARQFSFNNDKNSPTSAMTSIELNMLPPLARKNHKGRLSGMWPFHKNIPMYCLTIVTSDAGGSLGGVMGLRSFPITGRNEYLPIHENLFRWIKTEDNIEQPTQLHLLSTLVQCRGSLKDLHEKVYDHIQKDTAYLQLTDTLCSMVAGTVSPCVLTNINIELAEVISKHLGKTGNETSDTVLRCFSRAHGELSAPGTMSIHLTTRRTEFNFELRVSDHPIVQDGSGNRMILPLDEGRSYANELLLLS